MPMSYTPSTQEKARDMMWTHWCWRSCPRCWRNSVDISYSYLAGMNSLDKVCSNWAFYTTNGKGKKRKQKRRTRPAIWALGMLNQGEWKYTASWACTYRPYLKQTTTKRENLSPPLLSLPTPLLFPSSPLFYVIIVCLMSMHTERLPVSLPLIIEVFASLGFIVRTQC